LLQIEHFARIATLREKQQRDIAQKQTVLLLTKQFAARKSAHPGSAAR
jgi:hypothetical protein